MPAVMRRPGGDSPSSASSSSPPSGKGLGRRRSSSSGSSSSSAASNGKWPWPGVGWGALLPRWLPRWRTVDAAARRHGLGTFWMPCFLLMRLASPSAGWFAAHALAVAALSLAAHAAYAAMARWPPRAACARTAARCAAGCGRWMGMPLVGLHCLAGASGAQPSPAFLAAAAAFFAFRAAQVLLWVTTAPTAKDPAR